MRLLHLAASMLSFEEISYKEGELGCNSQQLMVNDCSNLEKLTYQSITPSSEQSLKLLELQKDRCYEIKISYPAFVSCNTEIDTK